MNGPNLLRTTVQMAPVDFLLGLMLCLCIGRFWLMPLPSSFWVDEMGTAFVVTHGADDPSLKAVPQVAESVYYILPKLAVRLAGSSEVSYRFFSLISLGGALLVIWSIAVRLFHREAAWFAVFGCLASRSFNYQAADARPYALGTLVLAISILLLIRWLDSGRWRDGAMFAAAASLLWWVHLLFWPFYILMAVCAAFRLWLRETKATWLQTAAIFSIVAALLSPVAFRAISLLHESHAHVFAPPPTVADLGRTLKLGLLAGAFAGAFLLAKCLRWNRQSFAPPATVALVAGWWLIDPFALWALSRFTGIRVFVPRYLYLAGPGVALVALLLVTMWVPADRLKPLALVLALGALILGGHWTQLRFDHQYSDWRTASLCLNEWVAGRDIPVICPSPFYEARPPVWYGGLAASGFLYSNLSYYPTTGRQYAFPYESSREAEIYARNLVIQTLARAPQFGIFGNDISVRYWRGWFSGRPELSGWNNRIEGSFGDVQLAVFTAPSKTGR
jgi:hypothetical protein